jgi:hypothetical protein
MLATIKRSIRRSRLIAAGFLRYYRDASPGGGWGGPFNGQTFRRKIFDALLKMDFAAILETGTYLGTTTEYFAATGLPVFTVEGHPKCYGFVRARFLRSPNVSPSLGDSRFHLRRILAGLGTEACKKPLFFYLDAHWKDDLPLAEELGIILERCAQPVIMIDDFEVAGDAGYGYDKYGKGKKLEREYIEPFIVRDGLSLFYPAVPSSEETGKKRGCAILVRQGAREQLMSIAELRPAIA